MTRKLKVTHITALLVAACAVLPSPAFAQNQALPAQNTARRSAVLIPHESWTCGMAEGIPNPESGTLVFEAVMKQLHHHRSKRGSGALVPTFEVRTDSPYAWLNTGRFLSSPPGIKPGGVGITIYESNR